MFQLTRWFQTQQPPLSIIHASRKDGNDLPSPEKFLFEDNDGADVFNSEALVVCEDDNPSAPMS